MTVARADWKWLRTALLDQPGFLPGMPWLCQPYAFERLLAHGLITRFEQPALKSGRIHIRAVITEQGREALAEQGRRTLNYLESQAEPQQVADG